jgi:hypothetical protein
MPGSKFCKVSWGAFSTAKSENGNAENTNKDKKKNNLYMVFIFY